MNSLKSIGRSRNVWHEISIRLQSSTSTTASTSSSAPSTSEIKVPPRIERSPTDILRALDHTVARDPTALHYKYIDDPYLLPQQKLETRRFAMARESGKKTAMWLHKEHHDLFPTDIAEPDIKAFKPPTIYIDESTASEEALMEEISCANVTDSIKIYTLLNGNVSNETKQSLLELLCFYNNTHPMHESLHETRWLQHFVEKYTNKWRDTKLINELFDHLKAQDSATAAAAYNALICGMAKAFNTDRSWELYTECLQNNIPLTREAFNYILMLIPLLYRGDNQRLQEAQKVCLQMNQFGIRPDVRILNNLLRLTGLLSSKTAAQNFFVQVFSTFKAQNIKPSLASYKYACLALSNEGGDLSMFTDILQHIQDTEFTIQDPKDVTFFPAVMQVACEIYCNRNAAELIHNLLLVGDNYQFIASGYNESIFYRYYLQIILATETIQKFFDIYNELVPQLYIPEPMIIVKILDVLESHTADVIAEYVPHLWSQAISFNLLERDEVVTCLLKLMRAKCNLLADSPLHKVFADNAWSYWTFIENVSSRRMQKKTIGAEVLGDVAMLLLRGSLLNEFLEVLKFLTEKSSSVVGVLTDKCVNDMFDMCIVLGYDVQALAILEYTVSADFEDNDIKAKRINDNLSLSKEQKKKLIQLVGADVLELNSPEN